MALCHITGTVQLPDGTNASGRILVFRRNHETVVAQSGHGIIPDEIAVKVSAGGTVDFRLYTGNYIGFLRSQRQGSERVFKFPVPEAATALFQDILQAVDPVEPLPYWLTEAFEARDDAVAAEIAASNAAAEANALIAPNVATAVDAKNVAVGAKVDAESARVGADAAAAISTAAANTATGARDTVVAAVAGAEDARDSAMTAASGAGLSASTATTQASNASTSASNASAYATDSSNSAAAALSSASAAALSADTAQAAAAGSVRFDAAQSITAPQKTQALSNIGAQPVGGYVRYDAAQSLTQANQDLARGNISAMGRLSGGRVTSGSSLTIDLSAYLTAGIRRFRLGINRFRPTGSTVRNLSLSVRNTSNAWVITGYANAGIVANTTDYEAWGQSDADFAILSAMPNAGLVAHGIYDLDVNNSDGVFTLQSNVALSWFVATAPSVGIIAGAVTANVNAIRLDTDGTYAVLDWTLYGVQR